MLDPFSGWIVDQRFADDVVIPPYDVMTPADRRAILDGNSDSYLHAILDPVDHPGSDRLELCTGAIDRLVESRMSDRFTDHYAVYRLTFRGQAMTGLVGLMSYAKLRWTSVLGHEQVKPDRVRLLAEYLAEVRASSSPAAVAVRDDAALRHMLTELSNRPADLTVSPDDEADARQDVWIVEPTPELVELAGSFDPVYVTDGHHRIAAAVAVKEVPILGVVFPASELRSESFHRILGPLRATERANLVRKLESAQKLSRPTRHPSPGTIIVWFEGDYYELPAPEPELVALHRDVIPDIDPRTDERLRYVAADGGLNVTDEDVVFFVPPLAVDFVFDVAEAGDALPPKSTRFYPKARSGVFLSRP